MLLHDGVTAIFGNHAFDRLDLMARLDHEADRVGANLLVYGDPKLDRLDARSVAALAQELDLVALARDLVDPFVDLAKEGLVARQAFEGRRHGTPFRWMKRSAGSGDRPNAASTRARAAEEHEAPKGRTRPDEPSTVRDREGRAKPGPDPVADRPR